MSKKRKLLLGGIYIAACILLIAAGTYSYLRWQASRTPQDPRLLFARMLQDGLHQSSVTCTNETSMSGVTTTQTVAVDARHKGNARSILNTKNDNTRIATDEQLINGHSYLRYTALQAPDIMQDDTAVSRLLNVWIDAGNTATTAGDTYDSTVYGGCVVPLVSLSNTAAERVESQLNPDKVFAADFSKTRTTMLGGLAARSFPVVITAEQYTDYMKAVAQADGSKALSDVSASSFTGKTSRRAVFYVDTHNARLLRIVFSDEDRTVTFQDYGQPVELRKPSATISSGEASKRLAAIKTAD